MNRRLGGVGYTAYEVVPNNFLKNFPRETPEHAFPFPFLAFFHIFVVSVKTVTDSNPKTGVREQHQPVK